jgi:hypothetical protein
MLCKEEGVPQSNCGSLANVALLLIERDTLTCMTGIIYVKRVAVRCILKIYFKNMPSTTRHDLTYLYTIE